VGVLANSGAGLRLIEASQRGHRSDIRTKWRGLWIVNLHRWQCR
jgi:hypothetical protein